MDHGATTMATSAQLGPRWGATGWLVRLTSLMLVVAGCTHEERALRTRTGVNPVEDTARIAYRARVAGTYCCNLSGGRHKWLMELHEDGSYEFFFTGCIGRALFARGRFFPDGDTVRLVPSEAFGPGFERTTVYRVVDDEKTLLLRCEGSEGVHAEGDIFVRTGS